MTVTDPYGVTAAMLSGKQDKSAWIKPNLDLAAQPADWDDPFALIVEEPLELPPQPIIWAHHLGRAPGVDIDEFSYRIACRVALQEEKPERGVQRYVMKINGQEREVLRHKREPPQPPPRQQLDELLSEIRRRTQMLCARIEYGRTLGVEPWHWLHQVHLVQVDIAKAQTAAWQWRLAKSGSSGRQHDDDRRRDMGHPGRALRHHSQAARGERAARVGHSYLR